MTKFSFLENEKKAVEKWLANPAELSEMDKYWIWNAACRINEYHPVIVLSEEDVLEDAEDRFGEEQTKILESYIRAATARACSKWDDHTDIRSNISDWAIEIAVRWAKEDGIEIKDDWEDDLA